MVSSTLATPEILLNIPKPPDRLFVKGQLDLNKPHVAIVGSRRATDEGEQIAKELAYKLAGAGVVVVSGLARGIDKAAHEGALSAGGCTVAILPSGIDYIYPGNHSYLGRQILLNGGAIISETDGKYRPMKHDFLKRNRLISGLSQVTVVVQAARRSGALSTARHALEQGREVVAVPGSILSSQHQGTNDLIRQGATPLTDLKDIFYILGIAPPELAPMEQLNLSEEESRILLAIRSSVSTLSELAELVETKPDALARIVTKLEIEGLVRREPGNYVLPR